MRAILKEMFGTLDHFGRFWLGLGLVSLAAAAGMSFDFGWGVSIKHALFLAILTAVAAFGPMAAEMLWSKGRRGVAIATGIICIPLLAIEFYSHAGYTAGLRGSNVETAVVQNTRYDGAQDGVKEAKASLILFEQRLADLTTQNAWTTSVTADALRAKLASAELALEQEAKRGGCKARCLARTQERDDLKSRIAVLEKTETLTKEIEATKRVIAAAREKASTTEHKSSAVAHQNNSLKKWVALAINGGTSATEFQSEAAEQSANLAMAIAGTGLPAFALFVAGLFRRPEDERPPEPIRPASLIRDNGHRGTPNASAPVIIRETNTVLDETLRRWAKTPEARGLIAA